MYSVYTHMLYLNHDLSRVFKNMKIWKQKKVLLNVTLLLKYKLSECTYSNMIHF